MPLWRDLWSESMDSVRFAHYYRFNAVKSLQEDLNEFTTVILPHCKQRPSVHNEVSRVVQELRHLVESIQGKCVKDPGVDAECFLPQGIQSNIIELKRDHEFMIQLLNGDIARRPGVKRKLRSIRKQIEANMENFRKTNHSKSRRLVKQRDANLQWVAFVADSVGNRPHIYNRVLVELQRLEYEASFQKPRIVSRRSSPSRYSSSTPLRWKREEHPTSASRWLDVSTIDEILDFVPETKVSFRQLLYQLKEECRDEAKKLQKVESGFLTPDFQVQPKKFHAVLVR